MLLTTDYRKECEEFKRKELGRAGQAQREAQRLQVRGCRCADTLCREAQRGMQSTEAAASPVRCAATIVQMNGWT
jgi:hypothetical protein